MSSRFSEIAHEGILLWNPLPLATTLHLVDEMPLAANSRVLDVGCGRAELLIRTLERTGARGVGVDSWQNSIVAARAAAAARLHTDRIELRVEPFDVANFEDAAFDLAFCIGSTHAAGGLRGTLGFLYRVLRPGGVAIVGEGFWRREPDPEYLAFLDERREAFLDRAGNLDAAREAGFEVVREVVSSPEDFDVYENRYSANVERFVAEHPDDPDAAAFLARIRGWRAAYLRWGRDTLGFALCVLRNPDAGLGNPSGGAGAARIVRSA